MDYNELRLYQEAGADRFSAFIDVPYRNQEGAVNGGSGVPAGLRSERPPAVQGVAQHLRAHQVERSP